MEETNAVPIVLMSIQNDTVLFLLSVVIVMAGIQRLARHAQSSPRECNVLQLNIQSGNTSSQLLKYVVAKRQVDVILLQEVWHPKNTLNLKNYQKPLRQEEGVQPQISVFLDSCAKFYGLSGEAIENPQFSVF